LENSETYRLKRGFITKEESNRIVSWVETLNATGFNANHHITEITQFLKGNSFMFDISQTEETRYITNFQKRDEVRLEKLPDFIYALLDRIAEDFDFSKENVFLQAVDMRKGGKIFPHYDAAVAGYINYKCNVSVISEDYDLFIDKESVRVQETDLYGFEASLYKHWTNEFNSRRVFLSFGFMIPYGQLGRSESDPRVRLSRRIEKYFQRNS
jgi:hypothetical protein